MSKNGRGSRWVLGTGIAGTVFIAGLAFWLSFTALTHLAMRAGIAERQAWAWPLIVDGIIVVATVAVVALRDRKGHRFSWFLLISGALVSVTANAVQAAMPAGVALAPHLAAAVSAVPPIVLLAITHLCVVLARHESQRKTEGAQTPPTPLPPVPMTPPPVVPAPVEEAASPSVPAEPEPAGLSDEEIQRMWEETQVPTPSPEPVREVPRTSQVEEAIRLKEQGLNNREIAARVGRDATTVGRWLKQAQARSNTDE
jgi:hypothetical protein